MTLSDFSGVTNETPWKTPGGVYVEPNPSAPPGMSLDVDSNEICRVVLAGTNSGVNVLSIGGDTNSVPQSFLNRAGRFWRGAIDDITGTTVKVFANTASIEYITSYGVVGGSQSPFITGVIADVNSQAQAVGSWPGHFGTNGFSNNSNFWFVAGDNGTLDYTKVGFGLTLQSSQGVAVVKSDVGLKDVKGFSALCGYMRRCALLLTAAACMTALWYHAQFLIKWSSGQFNRSMPTGQEILAENLNWILHKFNLYAGNAVDMSIIIGTISWMTGIAGFAAVVNLNTSAMTISQRILGAAGLDMATVATAIDPEGMPALQRFAVTYVPLNEMEVILGMTAFAMVSIWIVATAAYTVLQAAKA